MPASPYHEGQTATHKDGRRFQFSGGQWQQMQAEKVSPEDNKVVQQALLEADQARNLSQAAQDFMAHNAKAATGSVYTPLHVPIIGDANLYRSWQEAHDPDVKTMESLNARYAPQMRPVGTGRLMQQEYQGFKNAFPAITNDREANAALASQMQAEAARRTAHSEFLENYLHATGNLGGSDEAFQRVNGGAAAMPFRQAVTPVAPQRMRFDPKTGDLSPAQ